MLCQSKNLKNFDSRSRAAIFIEYSEQSREYKLLDLESSKVVVSRDVIFDEGLFPKFVPKFSPTVQFDADDTNTEDQIEIRDDNDGEGTKSHDDSKEAPDKVETKDVDGTEILTEIVNDDDNDTSIENGYSQSEHPLKNKVGTKDSSEDFSDAPRRSGRVCGARGSWWSKALLSVDPNPHAFITRDADLSYNDATNGPDHAF